jgi:hypothetical protein
VANFAFKDLIVRSFSLDWLEVSWEVENTTLDPHSFDWYIERSESPEGPWDPLADAFQDRYRFIDHRVNLLERWRSLYYRLKSVEKADTSNVVYSSPATLGAEPDLIAKEIQLLERTVWREFTGRKCWLYPVRTFGQYCPHCMDIGKGGTFRKLRSNCHTCYDTKYARGYMNPIELYIQFDPSPKSAQQLGTGETQQSNTTARMGNFPLVKPGDIIVESENRRWRVVQVASTERLRSKVHHELTLHELVKGDVEFQLPVDVGSLRDLDPSPERNFSNPQNLEAFEDELNLATLKAYGYDPST